MTDRITHQSSIAPAGLMLGIGFGGFFDGILLHQILQVYAMLSARAPLDSIANMPSVSLGLIESEPRHQA